MSTHKMEGRLKPPTTVGVLGGGRWGDALAKAAITAGNSALQWTRRESERPPEGVELTTDLKDFARRVELILLAVPSSVARPVATALGDVVDGRHFVVHATRGLSEEGLLSISEIVRQETPVRRVGALAGPVLADQLLAAEPSVIAVGSRYREVLNAVQNGLGSPSLRVSETADLVGLEWSSALVGALLVSLGWARALGVHGGLLAGLMTRGMQEAARIGVAAGAEESTFYGVAGFGDILAAMDQRDARPEVRFGRAIAEGTSVEAAKASVGVRIEAIELVPRVLAFARDRGIKAPLFGALGEVLEGVADKEGLVLRLMRREPTS